MELIKRKCQLNNDLNISCFTGKNCYVAHPNTDMPLSIL